MERDEAERRVKRTNEANVAYVIDARPAVEFGQWRKEHGAGGEAEDIDGDAKGSELFAVGLELAHEAGDTRRKHGCGVFLC